MACSSALNSTTSKRSSGDCDVWTNDVRGWAEQCGKSTLLSALRLASGLLRQAGRVRPDRASYSSRSSTSDTASTRNALDSSRRTCGTSSRRRDLDSLRLRQWRAPACGWPVGIDDDDDRATPFFFVEVENQPQPRTPSAVGAAFPTLGVVPMLAPIERTEGFSSQRRSSAISGAVCPAGIPGTS